MSSPYADAYAFGEGSNFPVTPLSLEDSATPDLSAACNYLAGPDGLDVGGGSADWPGDGGTALLPVYMSDCPDAILLVNYLFDGGTDPTDGGSAYPNPSNTSNPDGVAAAGWLYDQS